MNRTTKILGALAVILLLYLLFRNKSVSASTGSSSRIIDPASGIPVGYAGVRGDSAILGPALLPPNVPNDASNSLTLDALNNSSVALCPSGTEPIIDPETNAIYCIRTSQSGFPGQSPNLPVESPVDSNAFSMTDASDRIAVAQNAQYNHPLYYAL